MKQMARITLCLSLSVILLGCSTVRGFFSISDTSDQYLSSGSIIISRKLPVNTALNYTPVSPLPQHFAPLLGYIPPSSDLLPAINELWLDINAADNLITLYNGREKIKQFEAQGVCPLIPGSYAVQSKQKNPLWYASDGYFTRRNLNIPSATDSLRFRKGAFGEYAIFATTSFAIHSSLIWSKEVGGLKISQDNAAELYALLPTGSTIRVK